MTANRKRIRAMTAVTWLLILSMLLCWLSCMGVVTLHTAGSFKEKFRTYYGTDAHEVLREDLEAAFLKEDSSAEFYALMEELDTCNDSKFWYYAWPFQWPDLSAFTDLDYQEAVIVYAADGTLLLESGDYLYFYGYTQETWETTDDIHTEKGQWMYCPLHEDEMQLYPMHDSNRFRMDIRALRVTGKRNGNYIEPVRIDYVSDDGLSAALEKAGEWEYTYDAQGNLLEASCQYTMDGLDKAGALTWDILVERPLENTAEEDLVTVYGTTARMTTYEASPVTYNGVQYESLLDVIKALDIKTFQDTYDVQVDTLTKQLWFDTYSPRDWSDYTEEDGQSPPPRYTMVYAVAAYPLKMAMEYLFPFYLVTGLITMILIIAVRTILKRRFISHVLAVNQAMENHWSPNGMERGGRHPWLEALELRENFFRQADHRRQQSDEIQRLNTALDYARQAEENRRRMTSGIAHELKTPLAIIHSYSEGLKEHIAEEKREQYLDTILAETERMDGMVLQMLDLSRLEAGKVKLQRDRFSLYAMAAETFETFSSLVEKKALRVSIKNTGSCMVTADEARIQQVVRNFASNAVRYTPEGEEIRVRVRDSWGRTELSVENAGEHFTEEELTKVWENFYRTDSARSGEGTGLGLAIAKSIIELHGGKCWVKNTDLGVEFGFYLKN